MRQLNALLQRVHRWHWHHRLSPRPLSAVHLFFNGFIAVGVLAALAMVCHTPLVFPSVGPTAFLLYFTPTAPAASPRNTLCGHAIGIGCGYGALWLLGLEHAGSAVLEDMHWPRVLAAAFSLAGTGALMILFDVVHPPAGATTLIVALGIITEPTHLGVIEAALLLMTVQAIVVNRLAGIDYPLWSSRTRRAPPA
jgi:CBS-domain-containing membrane protein